MNQIPKAVFSRQGPAILKERRSSPSAELGPQPGAESWAEAYVASGDLAEEIASSRQAGQAVRAPWRWAKVCRCSPNSPRQRVSSW